MLIQWPWPGPHHGIDSPDLPVVRPPLCPFANGSFWRIARHGTTTMESILGVRFLEYCGRSQTRDFEKTINSVLR